MARHPLSPNRLNTTVQIAAVLLTAVVVFTAAGCSTPAPATAPAPPTRAPQLVTTWDKQTEDQATSPAPAASGDDAAKPGSTADKPTGTGWAAAPLDVVPTTPRLLALPGDFTSPLAVAQVYLLVWCYQPADQNANTNISNTAPWMTMQGWTDDAAHAVDDPTWDRTQAAGVSTVCGPATAAVSTQAPNTPDVAWVAISARQARFRDDEVIGQSQVSMVRRIVRAADGRWLVDVRVLAG